MNTTTSLRQNKKALVMCIVFFVAFILFSIFRKSFYSVDIAINLWMVTIHSDVVIFLAKVLSVAFDTISLAILSLIMAVFLFIKNRKTHSLFLLVSVGGNALFIAIIKNLAQVVRPENQLLPSSGFSYPSGHTTGAIIFIGLITYLVWLTWNRSHHVKILSSISFCLMVALVSFDRVYLNVHWLSDVVGGCLFGAFWLSLCILSYEQLKLTDKFKSKTA